MKQCWLFKGVMVNRILMVTLISIVVHAPAVAAEYLTSVTSEVYQTNGTPKEIATRASTCISQHLAPGTVDAQLIISSDLDNGVIVARSALKNGSGLFGEELRSRFIFEAREGRFRIDQTNLERFNSSKFSTSGWVPIGKWAGSGWKKVEAAFSASASSVAQCVMNGPKREDW